MDYTLIFLITTSVHVQCDTAGDFEALIDSYWHWRLEDAPEFATTIDVHEFDNRVEQYTLDVLEKRKENVTDFLTQLGKIDRTKLDAAKKVSYDVLKDTMETYLAGYKWKNYGPMNPVNFLEGLWTDSESAAPTDPKTYDDFYNYIVRIFGWADQALNYMKRMRKAIEEGTTNHWVSVEGAIDQIDELVGSSPVNCPMYKPLNESLDNTTLSESNKTALRGLAVTTINHFTDSFMTLKEFILQVNSGWFSKTYLTIDGENKRGYGRQSLVPAKTVTLGDGYFDLNLVLMTKTIKNELVAKSDMHLEYKNATRQSFGVNSLPDGEEFYKACLKWHLSIELTPEEIHQKGLQEVDRIHGEMIKVMNRLGFHGSIKEFFEHLSNDSRFIIKSPEETLTYFTSLINDRIKPKLPLVFKDIPDNQVVVKEMPYDGPGGTYSFGSPDGSRPGIFYANVRRPEDNPTYNMVALTLHEADPGHHLQDIYAQNSAGTPTFQKVIDYTKYFSIPYHFPYYTSYTEGWALYAESLGEKDQLDIYKDDYELMGRYSSEIFRACRLVVDTGLHHYNWTRERAIGYMLNYTSFSRPAIVIEINRYITWPGQATAYKIGELKIKELRQKAEDELGTMFDIKDFHSVVLDNGAVPLSVLEGLVDEWILVVQESDTLEKIMSEFWTWRMENSPEFSTTLQMYKYNDMLNSYKYEKFETDKADVQGFLDRLLRVSRGNLPNDKQISYDILKNILEVFLAGYEWRDYGPLNPFNFLEGWTTGFDLFLTRTPFDTQGDFVNYARRLELVPQQLDEMMNLSRLAISKNHTSNNVSVSRVPKQLDMLIISDPVQSELYKPVNDSLEKVFPDTKYRTVAKKRIETAIKTFIDKLNEVKAFIQNEYMPNTRPGLGIGSLPGGEEHYKACLRFHTSTDISPEDVHQKGLNEVARIEKLMRQRMDNVGFPNTTTIQQMYTNLTSDKRFLLETPEETLAWFKSIIYDRIQPEISKYISHAPNLPLEVRASASDGVGGEYWTGTADGSRPGIFYANVHKPEYNPTYKMVSLSLHEAIPGHHLAESYGILADVPEFRKYFEWISYNAPYFFPFYNAFAEGWALYAEFLGEEMGIYQNDYEMLGRYSDEMLRATRLVIDSGIHYKNWTRETAINYMLNYTAETPSSAAIEIDRYATWPGQACGYKIGELKIKELRQKASSALGSKFNLADFHYTVLKNGAMPLDMLEHTVDEWITSSKDTPDSGTADTSDKQTNVAGISAINFGVVALCISVYGWITL